MKKIYFIITILVCFSFSVWAQDDLLNMLGKEESQKPQPVYATFKSTRVINLQSNETMKAKHLDFRIQHRFGALDFSSANNYGFYNLLGLDGAVIRLGFEYGITDKVMVGVGRSSLGTTYDGYFKAKIFEQTTGGAGSFPVSITYFGNTAINTHEFADKSRDNLFTSRLSFVHQLIFTRKLNEHVSVILSPSFVHYNLVPSSSVPNDIWALGVGASFKVTRSTRFNIEYIPRLNGRDVPKDPIRGTPMYHDAVAFGFDIETGGHVFQLHFTTSQGLIEEQFIGRNDSPLNLNQLKFGFNISRTFSFDKSRSKAYPTP